MAGDLSYGGSPYGDAIIQRLLGLRNANVSGGIDNGNPLGAFASMIMPGLNQAAGGASMGPDPGQNVSDNIMEMFNRDTGPTPPGITSVSPGAGPSGPGMVNPMNPLNPAGGASIPPPNMPPAPSLIKSPTGNYRRSTPPAAMGNMPNMGLNISTSGAPSTGPDRSGAIANRLAGVMNAKRGM